ncbi:MAG TPA: cytochrome d ubiquinol oxidase subunit II [Bacteroidales bacterium]|nr:cytochrome d ubiquinol oxidase subunit II [Bacteroidales bacterium]
MFETLSHLALQQYWWAIISLLGGILVFLLFVQGGQTLLCQLAKNEIERTMLVNSLGRKWEFTFTTLVTFGGAFFASFPLFYSTSFGGAFWVWMAILFCFIIQAVSYEYRSKPNNFLGKKTYDVFLFINGLLGTILLGTAVSTFFTGSEFSMDKLHLTEIGNPIISQWKSPFHGLEAVANLQNVSLGLAVFFLSRLLAAHYFMNTISDKNIFARSKKQIIYNAVPFLVFFLYFVFRLLTSDGFAYLPENHVVYMEHYKYLHNLIALPAVASLFALGVVMVLFAIIRSLVRQCRDCIWFSGAGTIITVTSLLMLAGYNHTSFYPSVYDLQSSLTIENASSSHYTLTAMSYVSLLIPFVAAYIFYAWKSINNKRIDANEMKEDGHVY